jgi:hypothetical protein
MVSKGQMNVLLVVMGIIIICMAVLGLANSGYLVKEKKYVYPEKPNDYIIFYTQTHRAFIHFGSENKTGIGDYIETDTDYSIFLDKSTENIVFTKFANNSISLAPDYPEYFVYEKGTFLNQLGL